MSPLTDVANVAVIGLKVSGVCTVLLLARGVVWLFNMVVIMPLYDPLRKLPGPKASASESHFQAVMHPDRSIYTHEVWRKTCGKTFRFHGFGRHDYRLMSFDFRVTTHVLNSPIYEKPWQTRSVFARLIGRGIFSMEGPEHKFQRRLIAPAFSHQSVKAMSPVFLQKAQQLCDRWILLISEPFTDIQRVPADHSAAEKFKSATIDVAHWISRASFDVIGLAGFDYSFNSIQDESEEVYGAYRRMFNVADQGVTLKGILELYFPIIRTIWPDHGIRVTNESLRIIHKAGKKLVAAKKASVMAEALTEQNWHKDILSLLIKSNLSDDPSKRLSDAELLDQCSTFLLAGSDSVSLALAWCLNFLSLHPVIQNRLRNEVLSLTSTTLSLSADEALGDTDTDDKYNTRVAPPPAYHSLIHSIHEAWDAIELAPFLDSVVRETLRLCPPVHGTIRVATADDKIPISHPVVLRDGMTVNKGGFIDIRKGSYVHIPIEGLNFSTEIWGEDALQFNPDRWTSLPANARPPAYPGLGNLMTFGMGPHSCVGYKFTINEMKAFIATTILQFTFEPAAEISKYNAMLTRPYITDKFELGTQLPLVVGRYSASESP